MALGKFHKPFCSRIVLQLNVIELLKIVFFMASTKKSKKRGSKQWWRSEAGPSVSFMRHGDRVIVDFSYRPERVKAIKGIRGARFNPEEKSWTIPGGDILLVKEHREFATLGMLDGTSDRAVLPCEAQDALERLRKSPFAVPEEVIAAAPIEVVVRLDERVRRLRIVPRLGTSAYRILKRMPSAIFSSWDKSFSLPITELNSFVRRCRDKQILFAVEERAGTILRETALTRQSVIENPKSASVSQLSEALLTPIIARSEGERSLFVPHSFTKEQFKLAFPSLRRQPGKPAVLDDRSLLRFIGRKDTLPFDIWLTKEVHDFVETKRSEFREELSKGATLVDDVAADLLDATCLWKTVESGRAALSVNVPASGDFQQIVLDALVEALDRKRIDADAGAVVLTEIPDSKLLHVKTEIDRLCAVHDVEVFPCSKSFQALFDDIKSRMEDIEKAKFYTELEDVPPKDVSVLEPDEAARLFPHQRVAVSWLMSTPYAFLGDDMGLGKTLSVLSYFQGLRHRDDFSFLLVVCPNSLTRNWAREVAMWFPALKVTVLSGDKSAKEWTLRMISSSSTECDVLVVNYEGVRLDYITPELEALAGSRKTLLCLDESQRIKNPSGKTFKAVSQLSGGCDRRVLLSGTPTPKDVSDLWAQMKILDGGKRLGKSYYKWLQNVADLGTEFSQFAVKKFHEQEVKETIYRAHEVMLRRRKERVVNLPPKTFSLREVELKGTQLERYNEIREGLMLRMRTLSGEQFVREITNILEEYLRAVQVASNPRLVDPEWKGDPAKFLELDELVREIVAEQGQKIVIWTNYLGNIKELCERYSDYGAAPFSGEVLAAQRENTVRAFQEEESPSILVAVPAAGGVGITLTAAQTAIYLEKTWNAEHWMQSVDRIHRIGQTGTVNVISMVGCKVDEIIHWNLRRKEKQQAETLGDYASEDNFSAIGITKEELLEALE